MITRVFLKIITGKKVKSVNFFLYSRLNSIFFLIWKIYVYSTVAGSVRSNINNDIKTQIHVAMKNETEYVLCTVL